jgi:integrase/recombinase XerD
MEVNLTKRIETPEGRRYVPVVIAANGRVKPNWVLVNGRPEKYEAGIYYLDWRENGKRQRLSVGRDSDAAHQRKIRKLAELRALSQGLVVTDVEEEANKNHVKVAVHDFLEEVQLTKQEKTWRALQDRAQVFSGIM